MKPATSSMISAATSNVVQPEQNKPNSGILTVQNTV